MKYQATLIEAIEQLASGKDTFFTTVLQNGAMRVEYYAPVKEDLQKPHTQDEIYIITSGAGAFERDGELIPFTIGDVLFVPHGMAHRFINFTDDFATWVIFYGEEYPLP
jgi:mannose-6-phosphate isomerase-like protein (cupin superfamily)